MTDRLSSALCPAYLEVVNESHLHAGHAGDNGSGHSHFRITIISDRFEGQSRIARHRMVTEVLQELFKTTLHALSIKALAPSETPSQNV